MILEELRHREKRHGHGHRSLRSLAFCLALLLVSYTATQAAETEFEEKVPFIEQTLERSTEFYGNGMKTLVEDVMKVTGAPESKKSELLAAADAAVKDKMVRSKTGLWKTWKEMAHNGQVDQVQFWNNYRKLPEAVFTPDRSDHWSAALTKVLAENEMAKWKAEEGSRRQRIEKAIQDYLKRGRDTWRQGRLESRTAEIKEMETQATITTVTANTLVAGLPAALDKASQSWGKSLEKNIRESVKSAFLGGAEDRVQALENGQLNFGLVTDSEGMAEELDSWQSLLKQHLEPAAFSTWQAREQKRMERRVQALAMMTVAELDRRLRLTPTQREKLEPVIRRVVTSARAKVEAFQSQPYANSELLLMVVNGVPANEVATLIEPDQIAGWDELRDRYSGWWNQYQ